MRGQVAGTWWIRRGTGAARGQDLLTPPAIEDSPARVSADWCAPGPVTRAAADREFSWPPAGNSDGR